MKKLTSELCKDLINDLQSHKMAGFCISSAKEGYLQALEIALPILEQQEDEVGWIEWSGGECPVPPGKIVDLKLRKGSITTNYPAGSAQWDHRSEDNDTDIMAYRTIPEQSANQKESTPSNSKASVGLPKLINTPGLEVSIESLDSLIEKRRAEI